MNPIPEDPFSTFIPPRPAFDDFFFALQYIYQDRLVAQMTRASHRLKDDPRYFAALKAVPNV